MVLRTRLLGLLLGAATLPAIASSGYFIVTPMQGRHGLPPVKPSEIVVSLADATLPTGIAWSPYSHDFKQQLQVTGDGSFDPALASFASSDALPPGLSLGQDGILSGTPQENTSSSVRVLASYKGKSGERVFVLQVGESTVTLQLDHADLPPAMVGISYSHDLLPYLKIKNDENPLPHLVAWSAAAGNVLPAGLALQPDGKIVGTPTAATSGEGSEIATAVQYKGKQAEQAYTIIVEGQALRARKVVTGTYSNCALTLEGAVKCWGSNMMGGLGTGTSAEQKGAVQVLGLTSGVTELAGMFTHFCAIQSGTVKCWGANYQGQTGSSSGSQVEYAPVSVPGLSSGASSLGVGASHSCVIHNGAVKCWGQNYGGVLATGESDQIVHTSPITATSLAANVSRLVVGAVHNCAVQNGETKCWGYNANGQLGDRTNQNRYTPVLVTNIPASWTHLVLAGDHSCVLASGAVSCWGENMTGQLGISGTSQQMAPVTPLGMGSGVTTLFGGVGRATCAHQEGILKCWGDNSLKQLGTAQNVTLPNAVAGLSSGVTAISLSSTHSCAIQNSAVKCLGHSGLGQLGNSNAGMGSATPMSVQEQ